MPNDRDMPSCWRYGAIFALVTVLAGCGSLSVTERNSLGAVVATGLAGSAPTSEIEQTYYLGVFDPQDQLPPTLYRIRLRGQGGMISFTQFASGWVRAELIDSLTGSVRFDQQSAGGKVTVESAEDQAVRLTAGRRLVMFGPEGFREAPKNHRLVVVMGSSPEKFFQAVDGALGTVAFATQGTGRDLEKNVFEVLLKLRGERDRLTDLVSDIKADAAREEARQ